MFCSEVGKIDWSRDRLTAMQSAAMLAECWSNVMQCFLVVLWTAACSEMGDCLAVCGWLYGGGGVADCDPATGLGPLKDRLCCTAWFLQ